MSSQTPATKRYGRRSSVIALESGKVFFLRTYLGCI